MRYTVRDRDNSTYLGMAMRILEIKGYVYDDFESHSDHVLEIFAGEELVEDEKGKKQVWHYGQVSISKMFKKSYKMKKSVRSAIKKDLLERVPECH